MEIIVSAIPASIVLVSFFFLLGFFKRRASFTQALLGEMTMIIREIEDLHEYLKKCDHDWMIEKKVVYDAPTHIPVDANVFKQSLPFFHLLSKGERTRVIAFYTHFEACERLIHILFSRIKQQEESGKALNYKQVQLTRNRIKRILKGLESLCGVPHQGAPRLSNFPAVYILPTARETSGDVSNLFRTPERASVGKKIK